MAISVVAAEPEVDVANTADASGGASAGASASKEKTSKDRVATKGKGKAKKSTPPAPTHTLQPLDDGEAMLGLDVLKDKYGKQLRVTVSPEASWVAITGSHNRVRFTTRAEKRRAG